MTSFLGFRVGLGRVSLRLSLLGVLFFASACVPYERFKSAESELARAKKVNTDMTSKLKDAEVALARQAGGENMARVSYDGLKGQFDVIKAENDALRERNALLEARIREIPDTIVTGTGFSDAMADASGAALSSDRRSLTFDSAVLFAPGNAILKAAAKKSLGDLARLISEEYPDHVLHIEGHTDSTPIKVSKNKDNWDLGFKRAHAVFQHLVKSGMKKENFRLTSAGYAEPPEGVDPMSKDGMKRSRRVVIKLGREVG